MEGLQDEKALVNGGSSRIGQAIAIRLGAEGVAIDHIGPPDGLLVPVRIEPAHPPGSSRSPCRRAVPVR
ncbi:hypothetical protein [Geodermatophilus sp. SYSU D00691]